MSPLSTLDVPFVRSIESLFAEHPPFGPDWWQARQRRAADRFRELGIPTSERESWRQTKLTDLADCACRLALEPAAADSRLELIERLKREGLVLVLRHGQIDRAQSTDLAQFPVVVRELADLLAAESGDLEKQLAPVATWEAHPFAALNTALCRNGIVIDLAGRREIKPPLHVVQIHGQLGSTLSLPRLLIRVGPHSNLTVCEWFLGAGSAESCQVTSALTELRTAPGARLSYARIQLEAPGAFHFGRVDAVAAAHSGLQLFSGSFGGRLARHDLTVRLEGEGAAARLDGLYSLRAGQHCDNQTSIDHATAHTTSTETYKGVLSDRSRAIFNGRILVRPQAQKVDAVQHNANLLLGGSAEIHTRPQLEIYANDVRCTHGATTGMLDAEALFYLRTRGLSLDLARRVLIEAFAAEPLPSWIDGTTRSMILERVAGLLDEQI